MFSIGQLVSCKVDTLQKLTVGPGPYREIQLTLNPASLHQSLKPCQLGANLRLVGALQRPHPNHWEVDLGIKKVVCTLPLSAIPSRFTPLVGILVTLELTSVTPSTNSSSPTHCQATMRLNSEPAPLHPGNPGVGLLHSSLLPAMLFPGTLTTSLSNGLGLKFSNISVHCQLHHLEEIWSQPTGYHPGATFPCRLLYIFPHQQAHPPYVTINPSSLTPYKDHLHNPEGLNGLLGCSVSCTLAYHTQKGIIVKFSRTTDDPDDAVHKGLITPEPGNSLGNTPEGATLQCTVMGYWPFEKMFVLKRDKVAVPGTTANDKTAQQWKRDNLSLGNGGGGGGGGQFGVGGPVPVTFGNAKYVNYLDQNVEVFERRRWESYPEAMNVWYWRNLKNFYLGEGKGQKAREALREGLKFLVGKKGAVSPETEEIRREQILLERELKEVQQAQAQQQVQVGGASEAQANNGAGTGTGGQ